MAKKKKDLFQLGFDAAKKQMMKSTRKTVKKTRARVQSGNKKTRSKRHKLNRRIAPILDMLSYMPYVGTGVNMYRQANVGLDSVQRTTGDICKVTQRINKRKIPFLD